MKKTLNEWMQASKIYTRYEWTVYKKLLNVYSTKFPKWSKQELTKEQFNNLRNKWLLNKNNARNLLSLKIKVPTRHKNKYKFGTNGKIKEPIRAVTKLDALGVFNG